MTAVNMSDVERVVLRNQFKILANMNPENPEYEAAAKAVENGSSVDLALLCSNMTPTSIAVSDEVRDIVSMFRVLRTSYTRLEEENKLSEESREMVERSFFVGFDFIDEAEHFQYAEKFFAREETYQFILKDNKFSDTNEPNLARYRIMVRRWKAFAPATRNVLADDQVVALLEVR